MSPEMSDSSNVFTNEDIGMSLKCKLFALISHHFVGPLVPKLTSDDSVHGFELYAPSSVMDKI